MDTDRLENLLDEIDKSGIAQPLIDFIHKEMEIDKSDVKLGLRNIITLLNMGMKYRA